MLSSVTNRRLFNSHAFGSALDENLARRDYFSGILGHRQVD
jgi:hypothetical protein